MIGGMNQEKEQVGGKAKEWKENRKIKPPFEEIGRRLNHDQGWPRNTIFWRIELLIATILRQNSENPRMCATHPAILLGVQGVRGGQRAGLGLIRPFSKNCPRFCRVEP